MSSSFKHQLWWVGGTLFILQLISMGAMEMSGPFWSVYLRGLTDSDKSFSIASTLVYVGPMIGVALSSGIWGRMGDKHGHRLMMIRALLGLAVTQIIISMTADIWFIAVLRFVQGLLAGYIMPAQAYGANYTDKNNRMRLFAWLQIATNVGSLGGAIVGGSILDVASFPVINKVAGIVCFVCAILVWLVLPKDKNTSNDITKSDGENESINISDVESSFTLYAILLIGGGLLTARMVLQVPFALYMVEKFNAPFKMTGTAYGLMALGFIIAAPIWAEKLKNSKPKTILKAVGFVAISCSLLTMMAGHTSSLILFCLLYLFWGMALGGTTPILNALASQYVNNNKQGLVLGKAQSIQQIASVLGIGVGAFTSQIFGLKIIFPMVSAIYFLVALSLLILIKSKKLNQS
ncbi:MFS transporter [Psychrobacter pygoscelis]|uniref:MFS transporter n=1 Tax=Psychrobacter pygoscelis TaxID=2488563 RepID=UPI001040BE45|nr:MFS transporter [Psychrobacter pygoscelis]